MKNNSYYALLKVKIQIYLNQTTFKSTTDLFSHSYPLVEFHNPVSAF